MRATILVLDSFGVGAMPDAADWGDEGSDTLGNLAEAVGGVSLPNLARLGLGRVRAARGLDVEAAPIASFGRMAIASDGKDTVAGHWEMAGFPVARRFGTFPDGFPAQVIDALSAFAGVPLIGNYAASGTEIIADLGPEHLRTGAPIVYTSADSVLQIAAHEDVIPLERLYALCEFAFSLVRTMNVARVIARPFVGVPGKFTRTTNRKDIALEPGGATVMDRLRAAGIPTVGIGKIPSIYGHRGFSHEVKAGHNDEILRVTGACLDRHPHGLLFANLVDLDMMYGHRRDPVGYAAALREIDDALPALLDQMGDDDLLICLADHGCDPTFRGSDHTREYVPLLVYRRGGRCSDLGTRTSLADLGRTLCDWFGVAPVDHGTSFMEAL
jgi:phosphopentomutase